MSTLKDNRDAVRMKEEMDKILPNIKPLFDNKDDWHLSWGGRDLVEHAVHRSETHQYSCKYLLGV